MQMEADFALMSGELSRLIPALLEVLGARTRKR
jgi:DNA recombination-dependent growth factor C